jgi:hypothetical protein
MIVDEFEGIRKEMAISRHLLGGTEKTKETSVRITLYFNQDSN